MFRHIWGLFVIKIWQCSLPKFCLFFYLPGYTKLNMGLVVLVKKMSVLINFLLQNTYLVSVFSKITKFCRSCLTRSTHFANSHLPVDIIINSEDIRPNALWFAFWYIRTTYLKRAVAYLQHWLLVYYYTAYCTVFLGNQVEDDLEIGCPVSYH
jgi:hypothetical protein